MFWWASQVGFIEAKMHLRKIRYDRQMAEAGASDVGGGKVIDDWTDDEDVADANAGLAQARRSLKALDRQIPEGGDMSCDQRECPRPF